MLNFGMMNVILLNVILINVVMLNVEAPNRETIPDFSYYWRNSNSSVTLNTDLVPIL
jgi:hypothetical protein